MECKNELCNDVVAPYEADVRKFFHGSPVQKCWPRALHIDFGRGSFRSLWTSIECPLDRPPVTTLGNDLVNN